MLVPLTEAFTAAPPMQHVISSSSKFARHQQQQRLAPLYDATDALEEAATAALAPVATENVMNTMDAATAAVQRAVPAPTAAVDVPDELLDGYIPPLSSVAPDLATIALVAGQENYGLAIVCLGEAVWSFTQAPSFDHAKVLIPASVAALVLGLVSGPMITSGDPSSVSTGLFIATGVSLGLGASYVARLLAPFSPSAKEIAFLGLLVAVAGFFSFSQNLVVDGFVTLPSIPLPTLPEITLPSLDF